MIITTTSDIGLIGLAVMGANLARNIADKNFTVTVFNRTTEKTREFIKNFGRTGSGKNLSGVFSIKDFVNSLKKPRKIILLVQAGPAVDMVIEELKPLLSRGDIILDLGNSHYLDTKRRHEELKSKGINFIGAGISGGEKGALHGPSIMPGGDKSAYLKIEKILLAIAAKDYKNGKCVSYLGPDCCGHFVKMVHNGIEYGLMQLIAETYDFLKNMGKFGNEELSKIFENWNSTQNLKSFLIEITAQILKKKSGNKYLLDLIKDEAAQKGTGKWTVESAFNYGIAIPTITAAVSARIFSGDKELRNGGKKFPVKLTKELRKKLNLNKKSQLIEVAKNALELATIVTYIQGFALLKKASEENKWNLNLSEIARIWSGGCIIRSKLLQTTSSHGKEKILKNFRSKKQKNWRNFLSLGISYGIPLPSMSASLSYYDSIHQKNLPQNLIQAQRDFFGAHGYCRTDKKGHFHTEW